MPKVLITGSSKGLGRELALEFSRNKYDVIIHGRDKRALEEVSSQVRKESVNVYSVVGDLTQENTFESLAKIAQEKNIDILVNNAGIYLKKPTTEMTIEELREIMEVNFFAPVDLTKRILPFFLNKKEGIIVNINSVAGEQGSLERSAYCASKYALRGFSDCLKYEVTNKGIRILDFYLGALQSQITQDWPNYSILMSPTEIAEIIVKNCKAYSSAGITGMRIQKTKF